MTAAGAAKTRVAFVVEGLVAGGISRVVVSLAEGLGAAGAEVSVIVHQTGCELDGEAANVARLVDLGRVPLERAIVRLARHAVGERPDVLIAASWHAVAAALVAKLWWRERVPLWVRLDNMHSLQRKHARAKHRLLLDAIRRLAPRADRIIAVSREVADDFTRLAPRSARTLRVIENPVPIDRIEALARAGAGGGARPTRGRKRVIAVGSLTYNKNHAALVHAFVRLLARQDAELVVLGAGPEHDQLATLARRLGVRDRVRLEGRVANPYPWIANADVLAVTSRWEGMPLVLAEAMACGTPVVSVGCPGGPREVLGNGRFGRIVPMDQPEALAHAIDTTLREPVDRARLRARARHYAQARAIERHLALLEEMRRDREGRG